jgi:hypothetical protein
MSDSNVIYEAGQTLVELLRHGMTPEPIAVPETIGLCVPHEPEDFQMTVWIYNIETVNETGIHQGFSPDTQNSGIERYAPMQLRLSALITAHSKAPAQKRLSDEYRIIGCAIQLVHDTPEVSKDLLVGSLSDSETSIKLQYQNLNSEDMNKIWNNSGKVLKPSFGVQISSLTISSNRVRPIGRRVSSASITLKEK